MSAPVSLALLDLPSPVLLGVFRHLKALQDAVALSTCCKELHALGAPSRRRHLCCAACGHPVVADAADALSSETHRGSPPLRLPDGPSWAFDAEHCLPGCRLSKDAPLEAFEPLFSLRVELGIRRAGDDGFEVRAEEVACGGCGLHLGLRIVQVGKLRAGSVADCFRYWRELQVLGICFLGQRFLRLRAPDDGREEHLGRPPPSSSLAAYTCTAARSSLRKECGAVLFEQRDILSKQHCWDAGSGPERAFFINSFRPGAVVARNERPEELAQGRMIVADVHCITCGARIGWRFCSDLSEALENCNQVGRYGVVRSSIRKVPLPPEGAPTTPNKCADAGSIDGNSSGGNSSGSGSQESSTSMESASSMEEEAGDFSS